MPFVPWVDVWLRHFLYLGLLCLPLVASSQEYVLKRQAVTGLPPAWQAVLGLPFHHTPCPWQPQLLQAWQQRVLAYASNNGHPLAVVNPPVVEYTQRNGQVEVALAQHVHLGPQVRLASLQAADSSLQNPRLLQAVTGLRPGQLFSARSIERGQALLNSSPYFKSTGAPALRFDSNRVHVALPLAPRRANRFDALLGLLPPTTNQADWKITAFVDLQLANILGTGEQLALRYEELPDRSRLALVELRLPYLVASRLGFAFDLNLRKQDTTWQRVSLRPAAQFAAAPGLTLELFYERTSSSRLATTGQEAIVWPPPASLDGALDLSGLAVNYRKLDDPFNPSEGWLLQASVGLGTKDTRRSRGLDSLDFSRVLARQDAQEYRLAASHFLPVGRQGTLLLQFTGYWLQLTQAFENDLAFLGGAQLLRGFNDNQFLASQYAVATLEYRFRFGELAYIGAFVDAAYFEKRTLVSPAHDAPWGAGFTIQLASGSSLLKLSYGVGASRKQAFQPQRGRLHLGFSSIF